MTGPDALTAPATQHEALGYFDRMHQALGERFRLERLISASRERVLFVATDQRLGRRVSLRANFYSDETHRAWFLREAVALAQLDHPAIRHVYDVGLIDDLAYRVGNWVEGESLAEGLARGPRLIPSVHSLARDLLGALEHAHGSGIVARRLVPTSIIVTPAGRSVVTDLRFCNRVLPVLPAALVPTGLHFMAPEVRDGRPGDPTSDVYAAGAVLYHAITGREPALDPDAIRPASELRPTCPRTLERIVMRALQPSPDTRYLTAGEMLEDFASEAGTFSTPGIAAVPLRPGESDDKRHFEKRLRRALGDDYELLQLLGAGGFGRVYKVRDLHLERAVALKVLHPHLTQDPAVVERFRREAQLAARLSHPHIVNIHDIAGRSGLLWYTMEFIDGPSLAQLVDTDGPLPLDQLLRFLREALSALAHAHGSGLVHRDLKPENLLVTPAGALMITDFGLALALRGHARFGGATSRSGTPQFASPEQLLGERVDQRTDLYSLAAVACFALTGEVPFPGTLPEQILARQTTERLPDVAAVRADVPAALVEALHRALRAAPADRFPSAPEFLQAINRASAGGEETGGMEWARGVARLFRME